MRPPPANPISRFTQELFPSDFERTFRATDLFFLLSVWFAISIRIITLSLSLSCQMKMRKQKIRAKNTRQENPVSDLETGFTKLRARSVLLRLAKLIYFNYNNFKFTSDANYANYIRMTRMFYSYHSYAIRKLVSPL